MWEMYRELSRRSPRGVLHEEDGLLLASGSHPSPVIVNTAVRTTPVLDGPEVITRAEAFFRRRGHNHCICAAVHGDADVELAAADADYRMVVELTAMVLQARPEPRPPPEGVELRPVGDDRTVRDFAEVSAEAFEAPDMVFATFVEPRILVAPHIAGVVAYLEGRPVSAAAVWVSHGVAGVGFVGTRVSARGRGLGEAVTRAVTNEGFDRGARLATLQASPQGDPIYRRMGFEEISRYRLYLAPG